MTNESAELITGIENKRSNYKELLNIYQQEQDKTKADESEDSQRTIVPLYDERADGSLIKTGRQPKYLLNINRTHDTGRGSTDVICGFASTGIPIVAKIVDETVKDPKLADQLADFDAEARLSANLEHPNIVTVLNYLRNQSWREKPVKILITREAEGGSLQSLIENLDNGKKTITAKDLIRIIQGTSRGLDFLHSRGYAQRDLHAGNIVFNSDGEVINLYS